jgi:biotin transporter BioY
MGWIIYISGFIVTYLVCKWIRNKIGNNTWRDVGATIFASLFSWIMIIGMLVGIGVIFLKETAKLKNPPKWL